MPRPGSFVRTLPHDKPMAEPAFQDADPDRSAAQPPIDQRKGKDDGKDDKVRRKTRNHRIGKRHSLWRVRRRQDHRDEDHAKPKGHKLSRRRAGAQHRGDQRDDQADPEGVCQLGLDKVKHDGFSFFASFPDPRAWHNPPVRAWAKMTAPVRATPFAARILVVEDDDNIATALEFLILREGYAHDRVASGADALPRIRNTRPDLVLLDVMLPEVSGFDICEGIRTDPELHAVRVLMMTARGSALERRMGLDRGADGFISKPFEIRDLRDEVRRLLIRRN
jgi:CheY-like chemotaxis protein